MPNDGFIDVSSVPAPVPSPVPAPVPVVEDDGFVDVRQLEQPTKRYSGWESSGYGAAQGLTLDTGDELSALLELGIGKTSDLRRPEDQKLYSKESYSTLRDQNRKINKDAELSNPLRYNAPKMAGNIITTAPLAAAAGGSALASSSKYLRPVVSALETVGTTGNTGAGVLTGAANAFGSSEKTGAPLLEDTMKGGMVGGLIGGAADLVTPAVENEANVLARRAVGVTKADLKNKKMFPGGVEQANEVGGTLLENKVIGGGVAEMAAKNDELKKVAGEQIGKTLKKMDMTGQKIVDAKQIAAELETELRPLMEEPAFANKRVFMQRIIDSVKKRVFVKPSDNPYENIGGGGVTGRATSTTRPGPSGAASEFNITKPSGSVYDEIGGGGIVGQKTTTTGSGTPGAANEFNLEPEAFKGGPYDIGTGRAGPKAYDRPVSQSGGVTYKTGIQGEPNPSYPSSRTYKTSETVNPMGPRGDGHITFEEAQKLKGVMRELAFGKGRTGGGSGNDQIAVKAYLKVRDAIDDSIERLNIETGNPELTKQFMQAKKNYAAAAKAEQTLDNLIATKSGNRFISITDFISMAGKGGPSAVATFGAKKLIEARGYQIGAQALKAGAPMIKYAVPAASAFAVDHLQNNNQESLLQGR